MKLILLTTDTLHHKYYIDKISRLFNFQLIIFENNQVKPPFETLHAFENEREVYETDIMFHNQVPSIETYNKIFCTDNINCDEVKDKLIEIQPDIVIVFGNSKISQNIIDTCPNGIINLHGGDPEEYRGLDTHFWAIYHNDFSNLVTTIHKLNSKLDEGDIIFKLPVKVYSNMKIFQLRMSNTDTCIELTILAISQFEENGFFISQKQSKKGRYYSYMPQVLKDIVCKKFEKYTSSL